MTEGRPLAAAAWMGGAIVAFSSMAVAGRAVLTDLDTFEVLLFRSVVGIVIVVTVGGLAGTLRQITARDLGLHGLRNLCHFTGQNLWFWALTMIPLAQVFALEFTSPIWATLLAPLVLGEGLTRARLVAAAIGFSGVLVVARPDFGALNPGILAAAASALGFAGSALFTRRLTRAHSLTAILFWLVVMQTGMGLVCAGYDGDIALPEPRALPWLVLIAVAGLAAHFCLTSALRLAPAGVVMTMDFLRLPAIAVVGMLFYGEALDAFVLLGAGLILGANMVNLRRR